MNAVPQPDKRKHWQRLVWHPLLRPLNDPDAIDDLLAQLNPVWSLRQARARVVEVIEETADARTYVLRPNRHWRGFRAGQHALIEVEIAGVREQRCYSLSRAPGGDGRLAITVKRQPEGRVSGWLHTQLKAGQVLGLGQAEGEFVLPDELPERILLLSAGSGITPMRALLGELRRRGFAGEVTLLHACRGAEDFIFGAELQELARAWPAFRLQLHDTRRDGRLDAAALAIAVPDFAQQATWLCGPSAYMQWVREAYRAQGALDRLRTESFGAPVAESTEAVAGAANVQCRISNRSFNANNGSPLLVEAENAGLQPRYGCRRGICRTCLCRKRSGQVENLLTGALSAPGEEWIQLCISAARSDLVLDV